MANDTKQSQDKSKKRGRAKETFAELKKVTWPTFGKTMKQTGAVLLVTLFFLVILLVMDQLLGLAHRELIKDLGGSTAVLTYVANGLRGIGAAICKAAPSLPILL